MDPLSITASAAGLVTFVAEVVVYVKKIYETVQRKPELLRTIVDDLESLQNILEQLNERASEGTYAAVQDRDALSQVLAGCRRIVEGIKEKLADLRGLFERKLLQRLKFHRKFTAIIKAIADSRDQLERYKATLSIALNVRSL
jgi:hypothetical protein